MQLNIYGMNMASWVLTFILCLRFPLFKLLVKDNDYGSITMHM